MPAVIRYRNLALEELLDFQDRYNSLLPRKGTELASLVSRSLRLVAAFPRMHAAGYRGLRHFKVRKFPVFVYYRLDGDIVWIVAVLHTARDQKAALKGR